MRERAGLLNLVAELRGRLDELERLVQTAPNHSIISPVSYDEDGVVAVTPDSYTAFRAAGLARIREMANSGTCVLLVSHDRAITSQVCDRSITLAAGRIVSLDG